MSLPIYPFGAANCTFDVYRGFNPANPYAPPNRPAALTAKAGVLRQHVRNGRFGWQIAGTNPPNVALHWTTIVEVPIETDIRGAYDAELNAFPEADGDTVMMADYPRVGCCTAFAVVLVQRRNRGGPMDRLRIYLDRAQPLYGQGCPDPTEDNCCGLGDGTLHATIADFGGCGCMAGSWPLIGGPGGGWIDANNLACGGNHLSMNLTCDNGWSFTFACSGEIIYNAVSPQSVHCEPFQLVFAQTSVALCCSGSISVTITL